jgi:prevent-host-death family protein
MIKVNVATLKAELSKYLDIAQSGQQVVVTSHGQEIAKIGPVQLVNTTAVSWTDFKKRFPGIKSKKKGTLAARLIRQIRDED